MEFWVIPGSKQVFKAQFAIGDDIGPFYNVVQPIPRIDPAILAANGVMIRAGEQIVIDINDNIYSVFASTREGNLSNEVILQGGQFVNGIETYFLNMTTKGGLATVSYPWFE